MTFNPANTSLIISMVVLSVVGLGGESGRRAGCFMAKSTMDRVFESDRRDIGGEHGTLSLQAGSQRQEGYEFPRLTPRRLLA